jgi:hypothetical protein
MFAENLEDFLRSMGGSATGAAIGTQVKRPALFGKKFKLSVFLKMHEQLFSYNKAKNLVTLVVKEDTKN